MAAATTVVAAGAAFGAPSAVATTHYTASSCSGHSSSGMCIYYGSQNAWDAKPKENRTLGDWAYPGGQTEIANHIHSVTIYPTTCAVEFYTGFARSGSHWTAYGNANAAHHVTLPRGFYNHTHSFRWLC